MTFGTIETILLSTKKLLMPDGMLLSRTIARFRSWESELFNSVLEVKLFVSIMSTTFLVSTCHFSQCAFIGVGNRAVLLSQIILVATTPFPTSKSKLTMTTMLLCHFPRVEMMRRPISAIPGPPVVVADLELLHVVRSICNVRFAPDAPHPLEPILLSALPRQFLITPRSP